MDEITIYNELTCFDASVILIHQNDITDFTLTNNYHLIINQISREMCNENYNNNHDENNTSNWK